MFLIRIFAYPSGWLTISKPIGSIAYVALRSSVPHLAQKAQ